MQENFKGKSAKRETDHLNVFLPSLPVLAFDFLCVSVVGTFGE